MLVLPDARASHGHADATKVLAHAAIGATSIASRTLTSGRSPQAVRLLLMTTLRDVVWQGREHELNPLLAECSAPGRRCTSNGFAVARMRGHSRGDLNEV